MERSITYIKTIPPEAAEGRLKTIYDRISGPDGRVDNILMAHSLRPHTLEGHMTLYKSVLHHSSNQLSKWFLETIGVYVSLLNNCAYCVDHHYTGLKRFLKDDEKAKAIHSTLEIGKTDVMAASDALDAKAAAGLNYAGQLTRSPSSVREKDISDLRNAGYEDGEILEINQVTAYFAYANRTVLGLGCSTAGETLGLSPNNSNDQKDWGHQ